MNFLINNAYAQGAAPSGADSLLQFFPLVILVVVFYFALIRPQSKRAKEHSAMIAALSRGDEVVTNGGLLGKITAIGENFIQIEIAEGVQVKVQKNSVSAMMPKGTIKNL